jgi:hypothetical protein
MFVIKTCSFPSRRAGLLEFIQWSAHCDRSEEMYDHQKKLAMLKGIEKGPIVLLDDAETSASRSRTSWTRGAGTSGADGAEEDEFLISDALPEIERKLRKQRSKSRSKIVPRVVPESLQESLSLSSTKL